MLNNFIALYLSFAVGFAFITQSLLVTSNETTTEPYVIIVDYGGRVDEYAFDVIRRATLRQPIIIEKECYSACTLYLGSPYTCTYLDTEFYFHGPSAVNGIASEEGLNQARATMALFYRGGLKQWFLDNAAMLHGKDVKMLTGEQLALMGAVKICDPEI